MEITITKAAWEKMGGGEVLQQYGLDSWDFKYREEKVIDLGKVRTPKRIKTLMEILATGGKLTADALKDTAAWNDAVLGKYQAAKDLVKFTAMAAEFLRDVPGHRVYRRDENSAMKALYVDEVKYEKATRLNEPYCNVELMWRELGATHTESRRIYSKDIQGKTPAVALADFGLFPETPELRVEYEKTLAVFDKTFNKVGTQFLATGTATDDLDGNPKGDEESWHWRRTKQLQLDSGGVPARVVVDVVQETREVNRDTKQEQPGGFWEKGKDEAKKKRGSRDEDEDESESDNDEIAIDTAIATVPVWPIVPVFDLKRHLRLRIHVSQLKPYVYNAAMADQLVLPADTKQVVSMLLEHRGGFQDIVVGKGNGAIVLCVGPPGVGKTLTAEVYAETAKMPLYSVQCSQLGLTPEDLENSLLTVFMRAQRWNAILMLDEADVYVAERGLSIQQNAIVGVFLRVLEYYQGVLFLTSNRADSIDDAVASRCLAKLVYELPTLADQARIWKVLSTAMGLKLGDKLINEVVAKVGSGVSQDLSVPIAPRLSGRDIRNLLQLAALFSSSTGKLIDASTFQFARRFQPTLK